MVRIARGRGGVVQFSERVSVFFRRPLREHCITKLGLLGPSPGSICLAIYDFNNLLSNFLIQLRPCSDKQNDKAFGGIMDIGFKSAFLGVISLDCGSRSRGFESRLPLFFEELGVVSGS